jgi:hypothetical protein
MDQSFQQLLDELERDAGAEAFSRLVVAYFASTREVDGGHLRRPPRGATGGAARCLAQGCGR